MAELDGTNRQRAATNLGVRLAPGAAEADGQDISTSRRFGSFEPGDYVIVTAQGDFFMRTGDNTVTADATSTPLSAGVHDFVIPTGVTHVAIFASSATQGAAWKA